jgi:hypothetical protein
LKSCIGLVYSLILSMNWCYDPAMDHHQGDGNSLLHQVAPCYSSRSQVLSWHNRTLLIGEGRRGLFPLSRVGLNCHTRNEVKAPAAMGGSASAIWPEIQLTTMQTAGNRRVLFQPLSSAILAQPLPHRRDGEGFFHCLELVLTATRETR